ncbi:MAG: hypothetical protein ACK4YF_00190 [Exilispira sp.]
MTKKQVVYISFVTFIFSIIFPFLAIAPIVYFILSKNPFLNWIIFILVFCFALFLIQFAQWFNSSMSIEVAFLNYAYTLLMYIFFPLSFSLLYYLFILAYKKYNFPLLLFIVITAIPVATLLVVALILLKKTGFSILQIAPSLENLYAQNIENINIEKLIQNIINEEIPRSISVISISFSLLFEQHLCYLLRKNEELKLIIKPLESVRLSKYFSWITIIAIYSLIILKFLLKINNFTLEIVLYNIFYFLTSLHFINGLGVISFYYKRKVKPIIENILIIQLKSRPLLFLFIIISLFLLGFILLPYIIYIYFAISFLSAVDTIYPFRKETNI